MCNLLAAQLKFAGVLRYVGILVAGNQIRILESEQFWWLQMKKRLNFVPSAGEDSKV